MKTIHVLLVDDHALLRDSLRTYLELQSDIKVVGEAADGVTAIAESYRCLPDVIVLDMVMPGLGGPEVTLRLKRELAQIRVLILTQYSDAEYVLPCIQAGADGYMLKRAGGKELVSAIRAVYNGEGYLHPAVARVVMAAAINGQPCEKEPISTLTDREREILLLIGQGMTNREVSQALAISVKTVDKHRASVQRKLGIESRAALIRFAIENQLLPSV